MIVQGARTTRTRTTPSLETIIATIENTKVLPCPGLNKPKTLTQLLCNASPVRSYASTLYKLMRNTYMIRCSSI